MKFNIGLNAFLTRAQPFHVSVGVGGWGYSEQLSFFFSTRHCDRYWLVRKEEFAQDNIAKWGDPELVSGAKFSATTRSLSYESYLNYSICALT